MFAILQAAWVVTAGVFPQSVLESGRLAEQAYLTTGTILYQLCSADARCLDQSTVRRSLAFFEQKLLGNCLADNEETKKDVS